MSTLRARRATDSDVSEVARLCAESAREHGSPDAAVRDAAEVAAWLAQRHPFVVVTDDTAIVAFAVALPLRNIGTSARASELLVHVAQPRRRRRAGRLAIGELTAAARAAGIWKLVAYVLADNAGARAFLDALDYREVGVLEKHAQVQSTWRDVVLFERLLMASRRSSATIKAT